LLSALLLFVVLVPAPTVFYPLSLHDALPICCGAALGPRRIWERCRFGDRLWAGRLRPGSHAGGDTPGGKDLLFRYGSSQPACEPDRKSTRLNSSHQIISYAVFCLKKKKNERT